MNLKNILQQLNIIKECRKYDVPFWQCPQFLFLCMGIFIIVSILITYSIGLKYIEEPEVIALITLLLALILLILDALITSSFEKLAEASRMKSEFVSIVSHQLKTPLTNLRWALEVLISGRIHPVSERQLEYLKILKENSDRMRELVKDLLTVSKIEMAKLAVNKEIFSLEEVTENLIKEFEPLAKASNVEINYFFQQNLPKVFADRHQISQVIENLLDNAIRYIPGKGKVEIKIEERAKHLYFEIKDNGVGIPKEDQKYIFQKFFRSINAMKYQTQGTGLGLYISKSFIEKSGGKIGFKSQEGKGSTFWFTLPIK